MNTRPAIVETTNYVDHNKIDTLTSLVKDFLGRIDAEKFKVDIGEKNVGKTIRWYSVIVTPHKVDDAHYVRYEELDQAASELISFAKSMAGMERLAINILEPCSVVPMHYDNDADTDDGHLCPFYNLLVPLDDNGYSIVNNTLIKNADGEPLIFDPQSHHGAMNDTLDIRRNYFCKIKNEAFRNVST